MEEIKLDNVMQHYTTVSALYEILRKGIAFSDGASWSDKNDQHGLQKCSEYIGKTVYVACFCDGKGNAHHWTVLGKEKAGNAESRIKCSIVLDKQRFKEYVQHLQNCISGNMVYCSNASVLEYDIRDAKDILFLKRSEYETEHEFRVASICNEGEVPTPLDIKPFILKIVIGNCKKQEYEKIKLRLMTEFHLTKDQIGQNLLNDSVEWNKNIDTLIKRVPTMDNDPKNKTSFEYKLSN